MKNSRLTIIFKPYFKSFMLLTAFTAFEATTAMSAYAFGGGGGDDKSSKDKKCDKAKEARKEACSGEGKSKCEAAKEKKKKACGEETEAAQAAAEKEKDEEKDTSVEDAKALRAIDDNIAKIVAIKGQATTLKGQLKIIADQLKADADSGCLTEAVFATKKEAAIKSALELKEKADDKAGTSLTNENLDLNKASIELLKGQIVNDVPKVANENLKELANSKQTAANGHITETLKEIEEVEDLINQIKNQVQSTTATCSSSSGSSSSSIDSGPGNNVIPFGS